MQFGPDLDVSCNNWLAMNFLGTITYGTITLIPMYGKFTCRDLVSLLSKFSHYALLSLRNFAYLRVVSKPALGTPCYVHSKRTIYDGRHPHSGVWNIPYL